MPQLRVLVVSENLDEGPLEFKEEIGNGEGTVRRL